MTRVLEPVETPTFDQGGGPQTEAAAERQVAAQVGKLVSEYLRSVNADAVRLSPEQKGQVGTIVEGVIAAYGRRAAQVSTLPRLREPAELARRLKDTILGLGRLEPLMNDPMVEEIFCNGPTRVFVVREGRTELTDIMFEDSDELVALAKRLAEPQGSHLDPSSPIVDVRLPDGSRMNAVIPPAAVDYPAVTIRKFLLRGHTLDDLAANRTMPPSLCGFLKAAVPGRVNMIVSGATGAGKTTTLNAFGGEIVALDDRVITIETEPELSLGGLAPNCVPLQARRPNLEGKGGIAPQELVRASLRMRPERIWVGEVRGPEALDMLDAMNTGHDGSAGTVHANSPRDCITRIETMVLRSGEPLTLDAVRMMIAATLELVIQVRFDPRSRRRKIVEVAEVVGYDAGKVLMQTLWRYDRENDRLVGPLKVPKCLEKIRDREIDYTFPGVVAEGVD